MKFNTAEEYDVFRETVIRCCARGMMAIPAKQQGREAVAALREVKFTETAFARPIRARVSSVDTRTGQLTLLNKDDAMWFTPGDYLCKAFDP